MSLNALSLLELIEPGVIDYGLGQVISSPSFKSLLIGPIKVKSTCNFSLVSFTLLLTGIRSVISNSELPI